MRKSEISVYLTALLTIACLVFLSANLSFAGTVNLPKTGQVTCYDPAGNVIPCKGTGQDGEIRAGMEWPEPRFKDNGDGTVTDNLTGLMWLKNANCFGSMDWQQALDKVADFNANPGSYSCGGYAATYNDWRLPNRKELHSLTAFSRFDPALPEEHPFSDVQVNYEYWSSTTCALHKDQACLVSMFTGAVAGGLKLYYYYLNVWAVRGGQSEPLVHLDILSATDFIHLPKTGQTTSYAAGDDGALKRGMAWPEPRFKDNGDGTATDNLTGLMWLKNANCFGKKTWQEALDAVADLNANPGAYTYCGYTATYNDWALPNVNEPESLINAEEPDSGIWLNGQGFVNVQSYIYWSSTTYAGRTDHAWAVLMSPCGVGRNAKTKGYYVWPVRAGYGLSLYVEPSGNCGGRSPCYSTIQAALNIAGDGALIKVGIGTYRESITLNASKSLTIQGGWDSSFSTQTSNTTFIKAPKAAQGSLTLQMVTIRP